MTEDIHLQLAHDIVTTTTIDQCEVACQLLLTITEIYVNEKEIENAIVIEKDLWVH